MLQHKFIFSEEWIPENTTELIYSSQISVSLFLSSEINEEELFVT